MATADVEVELLYLDLDACDRVNGRDIAPQLEESACGACSSIAETDVSCRTWDGETSAPVATITDAILHAVYSSEKADVSAPPPAAGRSVMRFLAATSTPKRCAAHAVSGAGA